MLSWAVIPLLLEQGIALGRSDTQARKLLVTEQWTDSNWARLMTRIGLS